jgi:hypothetical protein
MAGEHIKALQSAAEAANLSAQLANDSAGSAWSSAFQVGLTAKKAQEEAERCQKENARMRTDRQCRHGTVVVSGWPSVNLRREEIAISLVVIIVIGLRPFSHHQGRLTVGDGRDVERGPWRRQAEFSESSGRAYWIFRAARETRAFLGEVEGQSCNNEADRQDQASNHRERRRI